MFVSQLYFPFSKMRERTLFPFEPRNNWKIYRYFIVINIRVFFWGICTGELTNKTIVTNWRKSTVTTQHKPGLDLGTREITCKLCSERVAGGEHPSKGPVAGGEQHVWGTERESVWLEGRGREGEQVWTTLHWLLGDLLTVVQFVPRLKGFNRGATSAALQKLRLSAVWKMNQNSSFWKGLQPNPPLCKYSFPVMATLVCGIRKWKDSPVAEGGGQQLW